MRFTHIEYRSLLSRLLEAEYRFAAFEESERLLDEGICFLLLRHDIDFDLSAALPMARLEAEMGVASTWFPFLRTEHYNPFSTEGSQSITEILSLGHRLGLHFDCALYPNASLAELNRACQREARMLEEWFGQEIGVVSFHRPTTSLIGNGAELTAPRLHTYQSLFVERITYLADSRGVWRYGQPLASQAFLARKPLHLLVHPIWWRDEETTPVQTLSDFIDRRSDQLEASVAANSTVYPPKSR